MNNALQGKTALVTGAGRRIGRQIALALGDAGVNVVIHYRYSLKESENLRDELLSRGVKAWLEHADFESIQQTRDLLQNASKYAGKVDFLINNASSFIPSTVDEIDLTGLMLDIQVNAWSPFMLGRFFARQFGSGKIVNLIDTRVVGYDRTHIGYILSKKLLLTLTELMAVEYAPRITVNAVAPGLILPPRGQDQAYLEKLAAAVPLEQHGDADDVSAAVLFLLASDFVTGQVIFVDGGRHLSERNYGPHHNQ